ncbi:MAG: tetratricopeptide repeat protein [Verrucomicrobiota bacterium]
MKPFTTFLLALMVAITPIAEAREGGGNRSGGGRSSGGRSSGGGTVKRSPSTGSKVQRPAPRPAPKPASRPASRPAQSTRPAAKPATRPDNKPAATRPAARPDTKPAQRPSVERPTTRPSTRPDANRPGGGDNRPGNGNNRPGDGNNRPGAGDNRPGDGNNRPGDGNNRPGAGNNRPGDGNNLPGAGNNRPGDNSNRPGAGNNRPGDNNNRPGNADNRPGNNNRPDGKPNFNRPDNNNRPGKLPGMVTYPDRANNNRPDRNNNIIGGNNNNNGNRFNNNGNRYNNVHIDKVNVNRRNNGLNRPGNFPNNKHNWDNNRWGGNNGIWGNNNNININNNVRINNNFRNNYNYAYRPNYWGSRPWWGASSYHGWHHGCWNYGYNSRWYGSHYYYNDNDFAKGFMWGIGVWSLGNLIYDMGYQSYRNPYPAPPVQSSDSKTTIVYTQPVSVTAAATPPGDEEVAKLAETKSDEALERSRAAFKQGDYVTALKADEEAIGYTPGDNTLHEYRALCLFALGKYGDAAGVLNAVLASGPGWGWDTMVDFYPSSTVYDGQLRKLEAYVKGTPAAADGHFLLGYQYLVCGYTDKAYEQFKRTVELQPADSIARQLRDLMKDSLPDDGASDAEAPLPPPPIPSEKLVGTWVSDQAGGGRITFKMDENGDFVWTYANGEKSSELKGTYGLDDKGLLVLTTDDSQMISSVTLAQDSEMKFVLVGSPTGDPGLDFKKS